MEKETDKLPTDTETSNTQAATQDQLSQMLAPLTADLEAFTRQMQVLNGSMTKLAQTIKHKGKHKVSDEFDKKLAQFLLHPNSPDSKKFLSDFISIFKEPDREPGDSEGPISIVKPATFAFNLQILSQASRLLPILQELEFFNDLEIITDLALNHFLPSLENNMATVVANKKSQQNKGTELSLFRYKAHQIAAMFQSARTFFLIRKKDARAAEESLNITQQLRTQPNTDSQQYEQEFFNLLKSRTKALKTHQKHNRTEWNNGTQIIKELTKDALDNAGDCIHYLLCAEIEALQQFPNYSLLECYCDLSESYLKKLRFKDKYAIEMIPFTATAALLHKIADKHKEAGRMNSALRCYQKALNFYQQSKNLFIANKSQLLNADLTIDYYQENLKKILTPIVEIQKSINVIQEDTFQQFRNAWAQLKMPIAIEAVDFETQGFAMKLTLNDTALFKVWMQQLHQLQFSSKPLISPSQKNSVTLLNIHQLSAQQLFQSLERAQKVRQADIVRTQKKLSHAYAAEIEKQRADRDAKPEKNAVDNSNMSYESPADKDLYPEPRTTKLKKQSSAVTQKTIAKPNQSRPQPHNVSWKEDLPEYVNEDQVYPIPDPFVANSCIPKGIFYGYIDHQMINEIDDDLLLRFQEVLSRGMIAGSDDAQGIRPVQGELGHDSDYYFKINIGRQNYRIYGRKVGEKQLPNGQMVVLIAFDQAIPHDQTLKLEHVDEASYQKK